MMCSQVIVKAREAGTLRVSGTGSERRYLAGGTGFIRKADWGGAKARGKKLPGETMEARRHEVDPKFKVSPPPRSALLCALVDDAYLRRSVAKGALLKGPVITGR